MNDYKFMKLLKDKKVADAYQYYEASDYKIELATLSYYALEKVITQYQENEKAYIEKVYEDAVITGEGAYEVHDDCVDYFGIQVSPTVMMDKLTMEILSLLHNFFDTFAQWINASFFAEDGIPMEKVSLSKVIDKLASFPEYSGLFIDEINSLASSPEYEYIADFNNTLKHRRQIYIDNKFDILAVKGNVGIPEFTKDGRIHVKKDALTAIKGKIDFCANLLTSSKLYIESYYNSSDNLHVSHRFENPNTYLFFESKEDFESMKSSKNHYYYIEVDPSKILDEYHFILCYDKMDGSNDERIDFFNSPYSIIMLRENGTQNIVGILKPEDGEKRTIEDSRELAYRKYTAVISGYEHEMFTSICSKDAFNVYPFVSNIKATYVLPKSEEEQENPNEEMTIEEQSR